MTTRRILVSAAWISGVTSIRSRYRSRRCVSQRRRASLRYASRSALAAAALDDVGAAAFDLGRIDAPVSEDLVLERESVAGAELGAAVVELLQVADGALVVGHDVRRESSGGREQLVVRHDAVDEPEGEGLVGGDEVSGEAHLLCPAEPDRLGEEHAHPAAGSHAHTGVGVTEAGAVRRNQEVAAKRELEPSGDGGAVDRTDDGLRHRPQHGERVGVLAAPEVGAGAAQLAQVEAGTERG